MAKKKLTCSCCGKEIKEGEPVYYVDGLIYRCCSKECLCDTMVVYRVKPSPGHEDEDYFDDPDGDLNDEYL